jgi:hypothetical protein
MDMILDKFVLVRSFGGGSLPESQNKVVIRDTSCLISHLSYDAYDSKSSLLNFSSIFTRKKIEVIDIHSSESEDYNSILQGVTVS